MKRFAVASFIGAMLGAIVATGSWAWAGRNSGGTYTSPVSPFVTGTAISSSAMNSRFGDMDSALSDSLSRSGLGGMSAPIRTPDGTVAAPCLHGPVRILAGPRPRRAPARAPLLIM